MLISAIFYIGICFLFLFRNKIPSLGTRPWVWITLFSSSLVLKGMVATTYHGYLFDLQCFKDWSMYLNQFGTSEFYKQGFFVDYPPGLLYVLMIFNDVTHLLSIDLSQIPLVFYKLPGIIFDICSGILIYTIAGKWNLKHRLWYFALFIFNIGLIADAAFWGQVDSFFMFFILLSLYFLSYNRSILSWTMFAVAFAIKPQALFFAPILCIYAWQHRKSLHLYQGMLAAAVSFLIIILPFAWNQPLTWIFDLYTSTINQYRYFTMNAFNLYYLLGLNMQPSVFPFTLIHLAFIFLITVFTIVIYVRLPKTTSQTRIFLCALFLIVSIFTLLHSMHERYLYPAIVFSLLVYMKTQIRTFLVLHIFYSLFFAVNLMAINGSDTLYHIWYQPYIVFITTSVFCISYVLLLTGIVRLISSQKKEALY